MEQQREHLLLDDVELFPRVQLRVIKVALEIEKRLVVRILPPDVLLKPGVGREDGVQTGLADAEPAHQVLDNGAVVQRRLVLGHGRLVEGRRHDVEFRPPPQLQAEGFPRVVEVLAAVAEEFVRVADVAERVAEEGDPVGEFPWLRGVQQGADGESPQSP